MFSYGNTECHAPCLMSLDTGEIGELRVYDMNPRDSKELAEEQSKGTFSFVGCAGFMAGRDTDYHTCQIIVPKEKFVLLDLYDLQQVQTYELYEGASYEIREYSIVVMSGKDGESLLVWVKGNK